VTANIVHSHGRDWFERLTGAATGPIGSVLTAEANLGDERARFLAIVPDPAGNFPRARKGEVGLEEAWRLTAEIHKTVTADADSATKRAIIAIVDVPSQAYGYREELFGLHQALAGATGAYATARLVGHPVVAFIVGDAISGGFLAHGLQANRIVALDDDAVQVQVMSKQSAARITRRTVDQLDEAAKRVPATASDIGSFVKLGALHRLLPGDADTTAAREALAEAAADARSGTRDLSTRLASGEAQRGRAASIEVRRHLTAAWETAVLHSGR
jgi:malonate decarboxylase beta subunit